MGTVLPSPYPESLGDKNSTKDILNWCNMNLERGREGKKGRVDLVWSLEDGEPLLKAQKLFFFQ